jgi:hypothetical protein
MDKFFAQNSFHDQTLDEHRDGGFCGGFVSERPGSKNVTGITSTIVGPILSVKIRAFSQKVPDQ